MGEHKSSCARLILNRTTTIRSVLIVLLMLSVSLADQEIDESESTTPKKVISLAESIRKSQERFRKERTELMQNYWKQTFADIKNLSVVPKDRPPSSNRLFNQWKLFLEDEQQQDSSTDDVRSGPVITVNDNMTSSTATATRSSSSSSSSSKTAKRRRRFEGFLSWDRLQQVWADDIEDYMDMARGAATAIPNSEQNNDLSVSSALHLEDSQEPTSQTAHSVKSSSHIPKLPSPRPVKPGEAVVDHTNLADKSKKIWIVTTASLPWRTGTAVNPLLRAAYLSLGRKQAGGKVTLMLPWLERVEDQKRIYGESNVFASQAEQEGFVRTWLRESANMKEASEELNIAWYTGRVEVAENSVYSMGDLTALIPAEDVDICILEEPEHLNWYRAPGESWTEKFQHVVGIVHTNYFVYAQEQPAAFVRAPAMRILCSWMCRAHCHRVIKLSGTLGKFALEKEIVENVHGVRGTFLDIGEKVRQMLTRTDATTDPVFAPDSPPSVYFIGKMLWSKGLGSLMELLKYAEESAGLKLSMDMYGGGPDLEPAQSKAQKLGLNFTFHGPLDHAELAMSHKIFINPSTSEVLCTTVAEALAMGKFVVLPSHPSNDFFAQFPNCLPYSNKEEFVGNLYYALTHSPEPLSGEYAHALSWQAATERLAAAGSISVQEAQEMASGAIDSGVEIDLPPLIEDDEQRKKIVSRFRLSRARYRNFRSRLSEEIKQSKVLPTDLQRRLTNEVDKRLDLDIDTILESPKLRLQLSPGELDKILREVYESVSKSPSGDVLRVIGGGANVGMQNLYMKQQARKQLRRERKGMADQLPMFPAFADFDDDLSSDGKERTPLQGIRSALRKNLPSRSGRASTAASFVAKPTTLAGTTATSEKKGSTRMMTTNMLMRNVYSSGCARPALLGYRPQQSCVPKIPNAIARGGLVPLI